MMEEFSSVLDNLLMQENGNFGGEPVLSDDIWNKFELDGALLDDDLDHLDLLDSAFDMINYYCDRNMTLDDFSNIRHHDCMWAGHCASKEHPPSDESRLWPLACPTKAPKVVQKVQPGRSLLLKQPKPVATAKSATTPVQQQPQQQQAVTSPESPPMSDDEEGKSSVLQLLNEAISECDDSDLCDYFEEGDEIIKDPQEDEDVKPKMTKQQTAYLMANDHSYHKDKNATMRMSNLGIETPSDSGRTHLTLYSNRLEFMSCLVGWT